MESMRDINEKTLLPLFGRPVCVVLEDDTRHTGILTSCGPSSLELNGERSSRPTVRSRKSKIKALEIPEPHEEIPQSHSYWGSMSLGPALPIGTEKTVIPLAPVRTVIPL
ncbi:hypothetical protein ACFPPD_14715 [Cohnella suwonensis]|uniref:Uncharacterized protein n=1 Tax=Cohnella suwonensis TaxID=696072 RepID=A0ABW0LVX9_9BACL